MDRGGDGRRPPSLLALPTYLAGHAARLGHARVVEALEQRGLTLPQHAVLLTLVDFGALPPHRVAEHLGMRRAHVSTYIEDLVQGGWVRRDPHPEDRRSVLAVLTEQGRELVEVVRPEVDEAQQEMLGGLSADEQRMLVALLTKLVTGRGDGMAAGEADR